MTPATYRLIRLEYGAALAVAAVLAVGHHREIRWGVFLLLFAVIDLVGYLPGAVLFRRRNGAVPPFCYVLYNVMHSLVTASVIAAVWATTVGPEWALLALPLHLCGDRALFGNFLKPLCVPFEPHVHPAYGELPRPARAGGRPMTAVVTTPPGVVGEPEDALEVLRRHSHHPSAFLALNQQTRRFRIRGIDGFIAYRLAGRRHLVQLCGPIAAPGDDLWLLAGFLGYARSIGRKVVAVQLGREDAAAYGDAGFSVNQMGASYSLDLTTFSLAGTKFVKLRNKVSRARRAGVVVGEVGVDVAAGDDVDAQLAEVDRTWLAAKGRHVKELTFMVGERGGPAEVTSQRRVFAAVHEGQVVAYIQYCPVFGRNQGWLHDLTRRRPDVPPGVLEVLSNVTAIDRFRGEGAAFLHLGLTPFTGLDDAYEVDGSSRATSWLVRYLAEHGEVVYPAQSQLAYKRKWGPTVVDPEYVAFQGGVRLGAVWRLLRLTHAV